LLVISLILHLLPLELTWCFNEELFLI